MWHWCSKYANVFYWFALITTEFQRTLIKTVLPNWHKDYTHSCAVSAQILVVLQCKFSLCKVAFALGTRRCANKSGVSHIFHCLSDSYPQINLLVSPQLIIAHTFTCFGKRAKYCVAYIAHDVSGIMYNIASLFRVHTCDARGIVIYTNHKQKPLQNNCHQML